jgi:hypothetical protein
MVYSNSLVTSRPERRNPRIPGMAVVLDGESILCAIRPAVIGLSEICAPPTSGSPTPSWRDPGAVPAIYY